MTEKHDIFLQVSQAPVFVITNSFLMEILDKTEERGGRENTKITTWLTEPDSPFVSTENSLRGMWDSATLGAPFTETPPTRVPSCKGNRKSDGSGEESEASEIKCNITEVEFATQ